MLRRCLLTAAFAATAVAVPATADASPRPVVRYDCNVKYPHPPAGTVCHNGVWVKPVCYPLTWSVFWC